MEIMISQKFAIKVKILLTYGPTKKFNATWHVTFKHIP